MDESREMCVAAARRKYKLQVRTNEEKLLSPNPSRMDDSKSKEMLRVAATHSVDQIEEYLRKTPYCWYETVRVHYLYRVIQSLTLGHV